MFCSRFEHALHELENAKGSSASHLVIYPQTRSDLSSIDSQHVHFLHDNASKVAEFSQLGFKEVNGFDHDFGFDFAYVHIPRSKALARHLIGIATNMTPSGLVFVDGAKTSGIDSVLKSIKERNAISGVVSRAHGKLFWFQSDAPFHDWLEHNSREIEQGFQTVSGVFSSEHIDPASRLLIENLPDDLRGDLADLGAGWGYLSSHLLVNQNIAHIDLIEVDRRALQCARINCKDERASFHWCDVSKWNQKYSYDAVVMNPPFHAGRKADPEIGRTFIEKAAQILKPSGRLFMVANRHLPYEENLKRQFRKVLTVVQSNGFKVLTASAPIR